MRKFILLTLVLLTSFAAFSQDFSNKGKDFYLCFPTHVPSSGNATLSIFITSDKASSGTITMPNGAFSGTFNIPANGIQEVQILWNGNIHINNAGAFGNDCTTETITRILKKSIRVKVDPGKPAVVAYAQQWAGARSAATLLLPTNVLGKKYFAMSFNQSGTNNGQLARSQFQVIAIKDNTVIQITPIKNGMKGTSFTVTLPLAGDMIQYQSPDAAAATQDLTGTIIESIASGGGGCLPIAVFSGSSNITFGTPACSGNSYDPIWQQLYPASTWGKNFGFMPFEDYFSGNPYRVMAAEDNTSVYFNGTLVATLNAGQIYPAAFTANPQVIAYNSPTYISADKPICVAQYAQADVCTGYTGNPRVGDPDMVILNPIEQNISDITIFTSNRQDISRPWINVLIKTIAVPSFKIDGVVPTTAWQPFPALPGYSYLRHRFPQGANSYHLTADSGFNAICYGWGNVESYAYSAGTYVKDLNAPGVSTPYGIDNNKVCIGSDFKIKIPLPYIADSIYWDLSNLPGGYPNVWTHYPPGTPDSVTGTSLRPIYWYSPVPNNFSVNTPGTYIIKATTYSQNTDGCGNEQDVEFEIEVTAPPTADFTWVAPRCVAETVQFNDASISANPLYKWWWDFGDPASGAANNAITANPTHLFTAPSTPGTYDVRYVNITTPGCVSDTIHHLVVVPDMPSATISGSTTVCINSSPGPQITFNGTGGTSPYTYTYTLDAGAGPGLPITTSLPITAPTNVAGTFIYELKSVSSGSVLCTQNITGQQVTITVNPAATVTPVADQVVCNGSPVTAVNFNGAVPGTVYNWTNNTTSIGLAAGGSGNIASFTAVNTGTAPVTATITVTPSYTNAGVTCAGTPATFTITVNPTPTVAAVNDQVVCNGSPVTAVNFNGAVPGTVYNWTNNTTSIGLAAGGSGNIASFTAVNTGTVPVTATITVTPSYTNAGVTCAGTPTTFTITVNPAATVTPVADQGVCNGSPVTAVNFNGTVPGTVYNWTNNTTSIGLAASGSGNIASFTAVNTGTAPVTATITVTPSYTNAGVTCAGTPATFTITVNPTPTVAAVNDQVVCNGSPVTAVNFNGAVPGTVYNWTNNTTSIGLAAGGSGNIASFTAVNTGTAPVTATITVTPSYTNAGVTCAGTPATFTITVNPTPTVAAVNDQVVCNGSPVTAVNFNGTVPGTVYNWTNNITSIGLAASGSGNIASFTAVNTGTVPVTATITVTPSYTNAGVTCAGTPTTFTITVNPAATVTPVADQGVCNGAPTTSVTFSSPATGGTIVYNWTNNTTSIGLATGGSGNIASFTAVNTGTAPVTATITVTPSYTNAGVTCAGTPATFTITVNPTPTVAAVNDQVVCNGFPVTAVNFNGTVPGTVYNWTNNTTSIGLAASGSGNIASFTAVNTGTVPVTATITVTPSYTNAGVTCAGTPTTFTITVNPAATVTPVADQGVCNGAPTTSVTFSSPATGGTIVYNWTNNTTSIGLAAGGSGNIASFTAVNTGTAPVTATITVTPSYTNAGVTCAGTPATFTITVNPTPTVAAVNDQVVCNGFPVTAVNFNGTVPGTVYNWTNNTTSIGLAAGGSGNIASFTAVNTGTVPVTATITVTPSYTNAGVTCAGTPTTFTITVNPAATVTPVADQGVCNGAPTTSVTFSSPATGGTIVYNWTNNTTSIGLAAGGSGNIASFTAVNTGTVPVTATITVTPSYTNAGVTCAGTPATFTITVNPTPTVAAVNDQVVCNGFPVTAVNFNGTVPGTVYNWTNNTTSIGLAAGGSGNIASFTAVNTGTVPVTATITVTPSYTNAGVTCAGTPTTFTITVNQSPTASMSSSTTEVCQNDPVWPAVTFNGANGPVPYIFTYTIDAGSGPGLPQTISTVGLNTSVQVQQPTVTAGTFTYKLISVQDGSVTACSQNMNVPDQVIKVNQLPSGTISGDKLVCINATRPDIIFTASGGTAPYTFTYTIDAGAGPGAPQTISTIGSNTSVPLSAPTSVAGTFRYKLVSVRDGSATACVQAMSVTDVVIDISDVFPVPDFTFGGPVCIPNAIVQFQNTSTISNGTPMTYDWTFGDGSPNSTAFSPSHQYNFATTFNVTLQARSNAGCIVQKTILVNNIHPQPKADFSFNKPGVCIKDDVTVTDLSDGKDGIINQWHWNMGDGTIVTTNPYTHTYTDTLTYNVTLYTINSFGCNSDTISKPFTVHPYPKVDAGPDRFILEGGQIVLSPVVYGNDLQFEWTPNLYLLDNHIEKVKVNKPLTDMTYTLKVTARGGCPLSDDVFIKLLKFPTIANTFTPNGDGINDTWRIDYLNTYPDNRVQIFTRTGQVVFESKGYNTPWDGTLKGKALPFDTYYYIIEPGNGRDPITGYVTIIK